MNRQYRVYLFGFLYSLFGHISLMLDAAIANCNHVVVANQEAGMGRKKLRSLKGLKLAADQAFSKWIRKRQEGPGGLIRCSTCSALKPFAEMQCGHFWKRTHLATRYHPANSSAQCPRCNMFRGGAEAEHAAYILKTYGKEVFDELEQLHRKVVKLSRSDYEEIITRYKVTD